MKINDMNNLVSVILNLLKAETVEVCKPSLDQQPPIIQVI